MCRMQSVFILNIFDKIKAFIWLCLVQIWQITRFDIISIREPPRHAKEQLTGADAVADFIAGTPARDYGFYHFNIKQSDKIGAYRAVPDTRDARCLERSYFVPKYQCSVSVIIVFHNEARSTLLRTILTIYKRTAIKYLHELIIIDDDSKDESLLAAIAALNFPPFNVSSNTLQLKMQRNPRRLGLIESRNHGASLASGDYLFFLDSHCEVNIGWLEPLLERIARQPNNKPLAVSPVLDKIHVESLAYEPGSTQLVGGFDWNLHFHWVPRRTNGDEQESAANAYVSPTFAGGVFMISRNWFFKLNGFNALLEIWGGEAIEFSIKHWLCGGQIEIVPCSRVGHIFRRQHSFKFQRNSDEAASHANTDAAGDDDADGGQITYLRNSKVIAESWLDSYKYFFYTSKPAARQIAVNISMHDLHIFKNNLNCQPFAWYLQHVFPSLRLPSDEFAAYGSLSADQQCLHIFYNNNNVNNDYNNGNYHDNNNVKRYVTHTQLQMTNCFNADVTQWYLHRYNAHLHSSNGICLSVLALQNNKNTAKAHDYDRLHALSKLTSGYFILVLEYCDSALISQRWLRNGPQLIHEQSRLCLDNPLSDIVTISDCRHTAPSQYFRFSMEVQRF